MSSLGELDATVERGRASSNGATTVSESSNGESRTTHGTADDYTLTSGYIGFVLPLMIELQHLERVPR